MRALIIIVGLLTTGCASSSNDLIKEARESGDWTAVNLRLDAEAKEESSASSCRSGFVQMCFERCECVPDNIADSKIEQITRDRFGAGRNGRRRQQR
jgi:hypothetical protein